MGHQRYPAHSCNQRLHLAHCPLREGPPSQSCPPLPIPDQTTTNNIILPSLRPARPPRQNVLAPFARCQTTLLPASAHNAFTLPLRRPDRRIGLYGGTTHNGKSWRPPQRDNGPLIEARGLELTLSEHRRAAGVGAVKDSLPLRPGLGSEARGEDAAERRPRARVLARAGQRRRRNVQAAQERGEELRL